MVMRASHKAEVAGPSVARWEQQKVAELRGLGRPWPYASAFLGKPEITLRQAYESMAPSVSARPDPSKVLWEPKAVVPVDPVQAAPVAPTSAPRATSIPWKADRGKGGNARSNPNRALALMERYEITNRMLADHLQTDAPTAGSVLGDLRRKGLIEPGTPGWPRYWRITNTGRAKLERAR